MDFLALPRRDLQALCKRNGVRANMSNAAMAEALAALPTVDGIEEYVMQPVAVPAPAAKAAVADEEEEPRMEKQGSPLPRGRRVTAKAKEPVKEDDATREPNKEDEPALGVGRRGASRRARPAPAVSKPTAKTSAEEKQGSSKLVEDDEAEEDLKPEANKEDAPPPVVGRRGASRRARPAPAAEPAGAGGGVEQREKEGSKVLRGRRGAVKWSEPEDREETTEKEDLKQKASTDDAPTHGVGRRGPSRRARPAPALEEQMAPIPRGRNLKAKSTEPIKPNDGQEEEKEGGKPEEEADVPAPVGRRGASRHTRASPAVAGNVAAEEPTAPIQGSQSVSVKSPEVIRLDDSEEDENEDTKLEKKGEDLPAIGMGRRGATRRAAAPAEAPATRRRAAASRPEAGDVALEAVPIRATRHRKPTMKAVEAVEEKATRRAPRRGAVRKTVSQQEEQDEPQGVVSDDEAVPAPISDHGCDGPGDLEERSDPQNVEQNEVVDAPKQEDEGAVRKTVLQQEEQDEPQGVLSDAEAVPAPVSDHGFDGPGDLVECSDPQNIEQNEVVDAPKQEDEDVVIIEDEVLMGQTPADGPVLISQECVDPSTLQQQQVDDDKCPAGLDNQEDSPILGLVSMADGVDKAVNSQDTEGSNVKPFLEEIHDAGEETQMVSSIQALEAPLTLIARESTKEVVNGDAINESEMGDLNEVLHSEEEISEVDTEDDVVSQEKENMDIDELQTELLNKAILFDCSGNIGMVDEENTNEVITEDVVGCQQKGDVAVDTMLPDREEISEVDIEDDLVSQKKENMDIDELQSELVDATIPFDCSGNISLVFEEKTNEVNAADGPGCQQKSDVAVHMVLPYKADDAILLDGSDMNIKVLEEVEDVLEVTNEMRQISAALDEDGGETALCTDTCDASKQNDVTSLDDIGEISVANDDAVKEKSAVFTIDMPHSPAEVNDNDEETEVHSDEHKGVVTAERQQIMATDYEVTGDDHVGTDFDHAYKQLEQVADDNVPEQADTDGQVIAQKKAAVFTEEMPQSTARMDEDVEEDRFQAVSADQAVATKNTLKVKMTDDEIDKMQQSTVTMNEDAVDDHFDTGVLHADEQEQVVNANEVPELTRAVGEIVEEDKAVVITEVPQSTGTMDEYAEEGQLKINFAHADDNVTEMRQTEDDIVQKEDAFTNELPQQLALAGDSSDHITSTLLEDVTESLSKSIITLEPTESVSEGTSVCNNSSEKNTTELPVAMQEEKGMKVSKKSVDLTKLSLGQLRTKIKEKLIAKKNKEAKRVALARVDENVCRSHSKGQQCNSINLEKKLAPN